jgi:hypothetical protein
MEGAAAYVELTLGADLFDDVPVVDGVGVKVTPNYDGDHRVGTGLL